MSEATESCTSKTWWIERVGNHEVLPSASALEAVLRGKCNALQREFKDERVVYHHMWYYTKLWENKGADLLEETEWV